MPLVAMVMFGMGKGQSTHLLWSTIASPAVRCYPRIVGERLCVTNTIVIISLLFFF